MCYLKQWRRIRTRIRNLMRLGVSKTVAIRLGMSSKGYYRLAKTKAVQIALNNKWLKSQGLVSVEVPLFIMAMNRPVRSRMQGGVGRAGEKLALTRFRLLILKRIRYIF